MTNKKAYGELGKIFHALYKPERIRCLELIKDGIELAEISQQIGVSRTGMQRFFEPYLEAGLVRKERRKYKITPKGEEVLKNILPVVIEVIQKYEDEEVRTHLDYLIKRYGKEKIRDVLEK